MTQFWRRGLVGFAIIAAISVLWPVSAQFGTTVVNLLQLNGTTVDTNSGSKSAGTLRVVLATDQPQLTNKLLVTPDANSAINVAQLNGTTTDTNSGNKSAGTLRTVIATDQPNLTTALNVSDTSSTNKIIWGAAQTVISTAVDVAAGAFSVTTTTFDNTTDSTVPYATRALAVGSFPDWAAAPVAGTTVDLYCLFLNIDGTSDETDAPSGSTVGGAHWMGSWIIAAADALQRRAVTIDISNVLQMDCYFKNGTAQNMNNDAGTSAIVKITPYVGRRTP
jgi:hypothetical protein